jgi:prevent-host-death family protein
MKTVTIHDAKTHLSDLIRRAEAGERIVIARGDQPVAVLESYNRGEVAASRLAGRDSLLGTSPLIPDQAFFDPLPDEELELWNDPKIFP